MPAPIAPCTSASEALTIWMLSTAMKAPSVAPSTAIQVRAETAWVAGAGAACGAGRAESVGWRAVMVASLSQAIGRDPQPGMTRGQHHRLGVDHRLGRHAGAQEATQAAVV